MARRRKKDERRAASPHVVTAKYLRELKRLGWRECGVTIAKGKRHHNLSRRKRCQTVMVKEELEGAANGQAVLYLRDVLKAWVAEFDPEGAEKLPNVKVKLIGRGELEPS